MLIETEIKIDPETVIIFNHIPKVGGTSVIRFFEGVFGKERCFRHQERDVKTHKIGLSLKDLDDSEKEQLNFVAGHFKVGSKKYFLNKKVLYIGVVRNPVDRFISDYYYNQKSGRPEFKEIAKNLDLEQYLQLKIEQKSNHVRNSQIEFLTGKNNIIEAMDIIDSEYLICCETTQLKQFFYLLSSHFNLHNSYTKIHENRTDYTDKKLELSSKSKAILEKNNDVDIEFIKLISTKFELVYNQLT